MVSQEIFDKAIYPLRGFLSGGYKFDMLFFGSLARVRGNELEANKWFDRALDDAGARAYERYTWHVSRKEVGRILDNLDDPHYAESWYLRAVMFGLALSIVQIVKRSPQYANVTKDMQSSIYNNGQCDKRRFTEVAQRFLNEITEVSDINLVGKINYYLGLIYYYDDDLTTALKHFETAARCGQSNANVKLGDLYRQRGNQHRADEYYERATTSRTETQLPKSEDSEVTITEVSGPGDSRGFLEYRAGEHHSLMAIDILANHAEHRMDFPEANKWYRQLADGGDVQAMISLGTLAEQSGHQPEAEKWYIEASESGNSSARYRLGHFARQRGDARTAKRLWKQSAEAGNCVAMAGLGDLCREEDAYDEAATWYRMAIDAGFGEL